MGYEKAGSDYGPVQNGYQLIVVISFNESSERWAKNDYRDYLYRLSSNPLPNFSAVEGA